MRTKGVVLGLIACLVFVALPAPLASASQGWPKGYTQKSVDRGIKSEIYKKFNVHSINSASCVAIKHFTAGKVFHCFAYNKSNTLIGDVTVTILAGGRENVAWAATSAGSGASSTPPSKKGAPAPAQGAYFACTGSTQEGVDITYGTDSSNLNGASNVPWAANLPLQPSAQYYNVTGQLNGDGSITCTTTVVYEEGGSTHTVTNTGSAQGGYNIASAQICSDDSGGWETC